MEALLAVAAHPDNEMAAMSFNFWHRLARELSSSFNTGAGEAPQVSSWFPTEMCAHKLGSANWHAWRGGLGRFAASASVSGEACNSFCQPCMKLYQNAYTGVPAVVLSGTHADCQSCMKLCNTRAHVHAALVLVESSCLPESPLGRAKEKGVLQNPSDDTGCVARVAGRGSAGSSRRVVLLRAAFCLP